MFFFLFGLVLMSVSRAQPDLLQIEQNFRTLEQKVTNVEAKIALMQKQLEHGARRNPYTLHTTRRQL